MAPSQATLAVMLAIEIADRHVDNGAVMQSSAEACLADARQQATLGNHQAAGMWALRSLAYSVGVFDHDYDRVKQLTTVM